MSEYQYVAFRALDRPVGKKDFDYMRRQSSRAEITPWSFENEYHYGDFRGNAVEMLRRGYDVHLHYANFGIRKLLIRLPRGLPNAKAARPYFANDSLRFLKDKQGSGGIVSIEPFREPGDLDDLLDVGGILNRLAPLRAEILDGDLRPFYLAHLAIACGGDHDPEETSEAPVPAGLEALSDAQSGLAELYDLGNELIAAAAQESPPMPAGMDSAARYKDWIRAQPEATKDEWLAAWMTDRRSAVRAEILAKFSTDRNAPAWPTVAASRTIAQLHAAAAEIAREGQRKTAQKAARQRAKRLAEMAADPAPTLREIERLVDERPTGAYRRVGQLLVDLRQALSKSGRSGLAEMQAQKLKAENPTLRKLASELRRQGLLPK